MLHSFGLMGQVMSLFGKCVSVMMDGCMCRNKYVLMIPSILWNGLLCSLFHVWFHSRRYSWDHYFVDCVMSKVESVVCEFQLAQLLFPHKMPPFFRKSTTWNHKRQVLHPVEIDHARLLWTLQGKWVFTMSKVRAFSPSCWHLVMWSFWVAGNLRCSCQSY